MTMRRGFTLIELLVVIAVLAILSATVFALLSGGRTHANDTATKEEVSQAMSRIEQYYEDHQNYGPAFVSAPCPTSGTSVFVADSELQAIIQSIKKANGGTMPNCATGGNDTTAATSWAIATPLQSLGSTGQWWCMDSSGYRNLAYAGNNSLLAFVSRFINVAFAAVGLLPHGGGGTPATCT